MAIVFLIVLFQLISYNSLWQFYPFGYIQNDEILTKSFKDSRSEVIHLSEDFKLYDEKLRSVYVCMYVCMHVLNFMCLCMYVW